MRHVRFHELRPSEIVARRAAMPVAFIGLGTIEWHGEHLPVGLDGLKAGRLCELAADASGGFAFPTIWYGEPRSVLHMDADQEQSALVRDRLGIDPPSAATPSSEEEIRRYQAHLMSVLREVGSFGMQGIVLLAGHHPLYDWAVPVVEDFNRASVQSKSTVATENQYADASRDPLPSLSEWFPVEEAYGADHAALWETSYLLALRPDCVDLNALDASNDRVGVLGADPRDATPGRGARAVGLTVAGMVERARVLFER